MAFKDRLKFEVGDRVVVFDASPNHGWVGTVIGRYGRYDNIPREQDTVIATTPWLELMYTVRLDYEPEPTERIIGESKLKLLADIPLDSLKHLKPPQGL